MAILAMLAILPNQQTWGGDGDGNAVERILVDAQDVSGLVAGGGLFGNHEISPRVSLRVAGTRGVTIPWPR